MAARTPSRNFNKRRPRKSPWVGRVKRGILYLLTILCLGFAVAAGIFAVEYQAAERKLDNLQALMAQLELEPTKFYSADGEVLYKVSPQYRMHTKFANIPDRIKDAFIAAEDERFYKHRGVDLPALIRIGVEAMKDRQLTQGGSTLTMQLAKRLYTGGDRTIKRKIQDMALAVAMERRLTKEQILELYLNEVFFGSGAYGITAASDVYFSKPLSKLTLGESAMLARCVRRPTVENPFKNYDKALQNRDVVLRLMREQKQISQSDYEKAKKERPKLNPSPPMTTAKILRAPYFVRHVESILERELPGVDITQGGYKVYTTIDSGIQKIAERAVRKLVDEWRSSKVNTGAFVMMDHKGRIIAEVGGVDFLKNEFNVITQGKRQPGSAFKPFIYTTGIAQGVIDINGSVSNAAYVLRDPITGKVWSPQNLGRSSASSYSVRTALALSINRPAVHVMDKVGPATVVDYSRNVFGFQSYMAPYMSLSLGACDVTPLEMLRAYGVFMTGGDRVEPMAITRIVGPDGSVLRNYQPRVVSGALDPNVARQMDELLLGVVQRGTATRAKVVPNAHGKTGTTSSNKDAWFCGYTDGLVGIGWIGNEQKVNGLPVAQAMHRSVYGGTATIKIWVEVMKAAYPKFSTVLPKRQPTEVRDVFASKSDEPRVEEPVEVEPSRNEVSGEPVPTGETPPAIEPGPDEAQLPNDDAAAMDEARRRTTPPEKPKPKPKPEPPPVEYVDVEICADSRAGAGMYCPETVVRTYVKGQAPRGTCSIHGPH